MVQSKFNLVSWFVSYNIFSSFNKWGPRWILLSPALSRARMGSSVASPQNWIAELRYVSSLTPNMLDGVRLQATIEDPVQYVSSAIRSHVCLLDVGSGPGASSLSSGHAATASRPAPSSRRLPWPAAAGPASMAGSRIQPTLQLHADHAPSAQAAVASSSPPSFCPALVAQPRPL
jgi:hypothetical protein